jgi:hypothetical protein
MDSRPNGFGELAMTARWTILAVICAVIAAGLPAHAEDTAPGCHLKVAATLPMYTVSDGRVTIPVQAEGHDYRLMLDTGGYFNTLSPHVAKQEGYRSHSAPVGMIGMGTRQLNSQVTVKDFAIAGLHGKDFGFYVDDFDDLSSDGTLSPQILGAYDADFDFGHSKFNLISPDHCPGKVVYWTANPFAVVPITYPDVAHIRIPVMVDGKKVMATLDTGAHTSFITMSAAKRYLGLDEKSPGFVSRGNQPVNGVVGPVYGYSFKTLSFGDVTVNNPHIEIISDRIWGENDLLLGVGILRQLHFYVAYKEKKLYVTPAMAK